MDDTDPKIVRLETGTPYDIDSNAKVIEVLESALERAREKPSTVRAVVLLESADGTYWQAWNAMAAWYCLWMLEAGRHELMTRHREDTAYPSDEGA